MRKLLSCDENDAKKRILVLIPGSIDYRGIQIFFLNILSNMNMDNLSIDLYFGQKDESRDILSILASLKVGVYVGDLNMTKRESRVGFYNDVKCLLKQKRYDCVHVNSGALWFQVVALSEAKRCGIRKRIAHSHNVLPLGNSFWGQLRQDYVRNRIIKSPTHYFACSLEAGFWMFGKKCMSKKGEVIRNGIDPRHYIYSKEKRTTVRSELGLGSEKLIIHIGAFNSQKNQEFLVNVFEKVKESNNAVKLLFIGTGANLDTVRRQADNAGFADSVIFLGSTNRVADYLQAADVFVLPSFFEGLGIVNIEAQAAGLHCIVSDVVPREAQITDLIEFLPLECGATVWSEHILKYMDGYERHNRLHEIKKSGYDVSISADKLCAVYNE